MYVEEIKGRVTTRVHQKTPECRGKSYRVENIVLDKHQFIVYTNISNMWTHTFNASGESQESKHEP